jgi:hypothetical protein
MTHASQGQHWYMRDGTPCYEVPAKDGSMRPATLRDARKLGLYPGVTSIIKCAAAPGLERWKAEQNVLAALTLPRTGDEPHEVLMAKIRQDAEEQGRKAREWGTAFHAAIQGHYEGTPPSEEMWPCVRGVVDAIGANFNIPVWWTEKPCASPLGYGTKADLCCLDGAGAVLDFKGSEFDAAKAPKLETWDEHHMQLAATRQALGLPKAECAIVYVSRTVPGLCRVIRVDEPELEQGWKMFDALLGYWQAKNNYYPQTWKQAA